MRLNIPTLLTALLGTTLQFSPSSALAVSSPDISSTTVSSTDLLPRAASKTGKITVGDGKKKGKVIVDIKWTSKQKVSIRLTVQNPEDHDVFGKYRVYFADKTYEDLRLNAGPGGSTRYDPSAKGFTPWSKSGIDITGVRGYACDDKVLAKDDCDPKFIAWGQAK
ncbi:hypothetical protein CERZMDRAFT_89535 [Cercospora zeae-maydis SCOH1-5]|uniref:Uncharacterized protein n=1 Tax=Cercospora zeae-maydis SCOH1-5 TaxID=717836 RepID=A0A6A6FVM9_9PEZI|nr:hypothetical protein CERZMDRAFT_89535 [Cercospora zeae-maydis SCOH1-5]